MEPVKPNCIICGDKATHRLNDESMGGFFYSCEKDECRKSLELQLRGSLKN